MAATAGGVAVGSAVVCIIINTVNSYFIENILLL